MQYRSIYIVDQQVLVPVALAGDRIVEAVVKFPSVTVTTPGYDRCKHEDEWMAAVIFSVESRSFASRVPWLGTKARAAAVEALVKALDPP